MRFEALREVLLKGGVAPRHVRRYVRELDEHLDDLTAQQHAMLLQMAPRPEGIPIDEVRAFIHPDDIVGAVEKVVSLTQIPREIMLWAEAKQKNPAA